MQSKQRTRGGRYGRDDSADIFHREIEQLPVLSYQQERRFLISASQGDHFAKWVLVVSNLRFVYQLAWSYYRQAFYSGLPGVGNTISVSDLIQEGAIALFEALELFNPQEHTTTFLTYAGHRVRQSIGKYIDDNGWPIKISEHDPKAAFLSLEHSIDRDDPESGALEEMVASSKVSIFEKEALAEMVVRPLKDKLQALIDRAGLDSNERLVLLSRFGFYLTGRLALGQIGQMLGVTRERVRQLEQNALKKIRSRATRHEKRQIKELVRWLGQSRETSALFVKGAGHGERERDG